MATSARHRETLTIEEWAKYHAIFFDQKPNTKFYETLTQECLDPRVVAVAARLKEAYGVGVAARYLAFSKAFREDNFVTRLDQGLVDAARQTLSKFERKRKKKASQRAAEVWNLGLPPEALKDKPRMEKCPRCKSTNLKNLGFVDLRPRYQCRSCNHKFVRKFEYTADVEGARERCAKLLAQGYSRRAVHRLTGVNANTLTRWNLEETMPVAEIDPAPLFKWTGGKTRLLTKLVSKLPKDFDTYFEPFVGAGALAFYLSDKKPCYISDVNPHLINVYEVVKNSPQELIESLKTHIYYCVEGEKKPSQETRDYYYRIREADRTGELETWSKVKQASRFIYLLKTGFNGLYRENKKGECNTPIGSVKNPKICNPLLVEACHRALQKVHINCFSYESIEPMVQAGDFVYLDPPYVPVQTGKKQAWYTRTGFADVDQRKLKNFCDRLDAKGVKWMLSNSHTELSLRLYQCYKIEVVDVPRTINCKASERNSVKEILVTNY